MADGIGRSFGVGNEVGETRNDAHGDIRLDAAHGLLEDLVPRAVHHLCCHHVRTITTGRWVHVSLHVGVPDQVVDQPRHDDDQGRRRPSLINRVVGTECVADSLQLNFCVTRGIKALNFLNQKFYAFN